MSKTVPMEEIQRLVEQKLGRRAVGPEDRLIEDLGIESLDVLTVVAALEDRYDVSFEDDELEGLDKVKDFHRLLAGKL